MEDDTPAAAAAAAAASTGVAGLELHRGVFNAAEQDELVAFVDRMLAKGEAGQLLPNTFRPNTNRTFVKRAQSRDTLQFGNCYTHQNRVYNGEVEAVPPLLNECIQKLINGGIFTEDTRPTTCTVNVYKPGQWLPPHVDNRNFARPFCTVSLCSEEAVIFGGKIEKVAIASSGVGSGDGGASGSGGESKGSGGKGSSKGGGGNFKGGTTIYMPVGSALRVAGEAADTLYHAVPAATARRISLTFRRLKSHCAAEFAKSEAGLPMFCNHPRPIHKCKSCVLSPGGSPPPPPSDAADPNAAAAAAGGAAADAADATDTPPTIAHARKAGASVLSREAFDASSSSSSSPGSSGLKEGAHKGPPAWCPGLQVFNRMAAQRDEELAKRQDELKRQYAASESEAQVAVVAELGRIALLEKQHEAGREAAAARDKATLEERVANLDFGGFSFAAAGAAPPKPPN